MKFRSGLTLVEMLITIFILGIIVIIISNLFIGSTRFARDEQLRIDVGENAARIFSTTDETLRQGKQVLTDATINSVLYTTDADTLVFALPSLVGGKPSGFDDDIDLCVILLDTTVSNNTRLRLIIEPDGVSEREPVDRTLIEQVKDVYFRYTNTNPSLATAVTVTVTVEEQVNNRPFTRANILYASFRNHP